MFIISIILLVIIVIAIYNYYVYNNMLTIFLAISVMILLLYNATDNYIFITIICSYVIIITKILLEAIKIFEIHADSDFIKSIIKTITNNIPNIHDNTSIFKNSMMILKEYLPFILGSSLAVFYMFFYTITKLRIDLAIASNCKKLNKFVEINTIRNKINVFAHENNDRLKRYLILFLISIITVALVVIYHNNIEVYYIYLIPILILSIIFASVELNSLTTESVSKL